MKKLFLSAMGAMMLATSGFAQDIFDAGEQDPYLGVRASLDITGVAGNISNIYDFNNGAGFSVGAVYNITLFKNLYFEPGLSVFYNTAGYDGFMYDSNDEFGVKGSIRNFGFRIPLVAGYHFDFTEDMKVSVFTGPQMNIGLVGRNVGDIAIRNNMEHYSESIYGDGVRRFDLQWMFGAAFHYQKYYISLSGCVGLTNLLGGTDYKGFTARRNTFAITLGYNL